MARPASFICVLFILCVTALLLAACAESEGDSQTKLNADRGRAFLEQNKNDSSVVTLDSGLQYRVLNAGNGDPVRITDTVTVHYHGTHLDGSTFHNSYERGEPENVRVKAMIPGWKQALLRMHEGDKWRLFIPHHLAYSNRGAGDIAPNETLIFELEIVRIN